MRRQIIRLVPWITGLALAVGVTWIDQAWAYEAWVTNQEDHTVIVIDTETNKVIDTITPGGKKPHNIAFSPDGVHAFIANAASNDVSMVDVKTRKLVATLPAGTKPTVLPSLRMAGSSGWRTRDPTM